MTWWGKVAEELDAIRSARNARPNAVTRDVVEGFSGPVIQTSHRVIPPKPALPPPDPLPPTHFPDNGRLLDSKESFLSTGRKGKW